jgi:hypothetical protein
MEKAILTSIIITLTTVLCGQDIKISVAPTINAAPAYLAVGGPGQNIKAGFSTSADYRHITDKRVTFGFGFYYQYSQVEFVPNLNSGDMLLTTEKVNLASVIFRSIYDLKKDFYLSFDPVVDLHIGYDSEQIIDNQTGLGLSLAFGKSIKIKDTIFLNIEPRLWIHNIVPFHDINIPYRLTTAGLNIGVVFKQKNDSQI